MRTNNKHFWHYVDLFVGLTFLYILDRLIKIGFMKSPDNFGDFLNWLPFSKQFYTNEGIFFGLHSPQIITILFSIVVLLAVAYYLVNTLKKQNILQAVAWGIIMVGGISNLYDRFVYGFVIDWWVMPWNAVINLADVYITVGIIILILNLKKKT